MLDFCKMAGNETGYAMLGVFGEISCPIVMNLTREPNLTYPLNPNIVYPMLTAWLFSIFCLYILSRRDNHLSSHTKFSARNIWQMDNSLS